MKEFSHFLTPNLSTGLRKSKKFRINEAVLREAHNVVVDKDGLRPLRLPRNLSTIVGIPFDYPFPQIVSLFNELYFLGKEAVSHWDGGDTTQVELTEVSDGDTKVYLNTAGPWHVANFEAFWYAASGEDVVFFDPSAEKVFIDTTLNVQSACALAGGSRLVLGGFLPQSGTTRALGVAWKRFFEEWQEKIPWISELSESFDFDETTVWWSSVGGEDALMLHKPEEFLQISETTPEPYIFTLIRKNEMGFTRLAGIGRVSTILPLGTGFVVYGRTATYLATFDAGLNTFGFKRLSVPAAVDRLSAAGTGSKHIWIDAKGVLHLLEEGGKHTPLGYDWLLSNRAFWQLSYDEVEDVFYIAGLESTYILSDTGLTGGRFSISSVLQFQGDSYSVRDQISDPTASILTEITDFGIRALKTLTSLEMSVGGSDLNPQARVWVRYSREENFQPSPWIDLNNRGFVRVEVTGVEFMVEFKADNYEELELNTLIAKWQAADKTNIRGQYGSKADF